MCGIFSFAGIVRENQWKETFDILTALFVASECRGKDASGFVAVTEPYKDSILSVGLVSDKKPLTASQFVQQNKAWLSLRHRRCSMLLGHTRLATHGTSENPDNLHPFRQHGRGGGTIHVVANGVVGNYLEVAEQFGFKLRGENDCEVISHLVSHTADPKRGLELALSLCEGSLAIAALDEQRFCTWLACKEGRPLWGARLRHDRRWFFASTREILMQAFSQVLGKVSVTDFDCIFPLAEYSVVCLTRDGLLLG